jgi:glycosyltransferase involved in cell wall biosynthesis
MQTIHVIAGLDPRDGGPTYSVPSLCASLTRAGCNTRMMTVRSDGCVERPDLQAFAQFARQAPVLGSLRLSPGLRRAAAAQAMRSDVVHAHGLWLMPNVDAGNAAAQAHASLVVSPRGMLAKEALEYSSLKKRLFWHLLQRRAYARAAAWHATSDQEAAEIRAFGIDAPIAVIPNGIDLPDVLADHDEARPRRRLLFLSRIHPKKGLPVLLDAWSQLAAERPDWDLVIAGADEGGHRGELEARVATDGIPNVVFTGPLYGEAKTALLKATDLFVLPTRNENFGIAVAEALAAGIPAVVTTGAPWSGLASERCGWWIEQGLEPLLDALSDATALPATDRRAMGLRGRAWMERDFGWDRIGQQMCAVYKWLASDGPRPPEVQTR